MEEPARCMKELDHDLRQSCTNELRSRCVEEIRDHIGNVSTAVRETQSFDQSRIRRL
jgi:hypothetical protein